MAAFAYSFCMALLHSIWQAVALAVGYLLFNALYKKISPQQNRNLLLLTIITQVLLFLITLFVQLFGATNNNLFDINFANYLPQQGNASLFYQLAFGIYILIVVRKITSTLYQWHGFKKQMLHSYIKPNIDVRLFTTAKALHLGIKKRVQIWYSNQIHTPITFGFFKPIILLPFSLVTNLSIQQTEAIILHELAHIKANDYLSNWLITFAETIFFFNPFILLLCKKLRLQRELHCDSMVLQYNYSPIIYAEALLAAATYQHKKLSFTVAATSTKKELLQRIKYFTSFNNQNSKSPFKWMFAFLMGLLSLLFTITLQTKQSQFAAKELFSLPLFGIQTKRVSTTNSNIETKKTFVTKPIYSSTKTVENNVKSKIVEVKNLAAVQLPENSEYKFVPVLNNDKNNAPQQIIIEEEQSGNKPAVMMIYKATNVNGEWIIEPQMIITKATKTTNSQVIDSSSPAKKNIEQ